MGMRTSLGEHTAVVALRPNGREIERLELAYATRSKVAMAAGTLRGRIRAEHGFTPTMVALEYGKGGRFTRDVTAIWAEYL